MYYCKECEIELRTPIGVERNGEMIKVCPFCDNEVIECSDIDEEIARELEEKEDLIFSLRMLAQNLIGYSRMNSNDLLAGYNIRREDLDRMGLVPFEELDEPWEE